MWTLVALAFASSLPEPSIVPDVGGQRFAFATVADWYSAGADGVVHQWRGQSHEGTVDGVTARHLLVAHEGRLAVDQGIWADGEVTVSFPDRPVGAGKDERWNALHQAVSADLSTWVVHWGFRPPRLKRGEDGTYTPTGSAAPASHPRNFIARYQIGEDGVTGETVVRENATGVTRLELDGNALVQIDFRSLSVVPGTGEAQTTPVTGRLRELAISPSWIVAGGGIAHPEPRGDLVARSRTNDVTATWTTEVPVLSLAVHPTAGLVAVGGAGVASLWSLGASPEAVHSLSFPIEGDNGSVGEVQGAAFSPDGRWLVLGVDHGGARVHIYDVSGLVDK